MTTRFLMIASGLVAGVLASLLASQISLRELIPVRVSRSVRGGPQTGTAVTIAGQPYDNSIAMRRVPRLSMN